MNPLSIHPGTTPAAVPAPAGTAPAPQVPATAPAQPATAPRSDGPAREAVREHLEHLAPAISSLQEQAGRLTAWGVDLARRLHAGHRLLAAGNGGSAAEAQHLTAELVGRFDGERRAFSAIALHAETSAVTAIGNDYGFEELYARQVAAHGRSGDVLVLLSTSGRSPNLLRAAAAARTAGITTWALTGSAPNPLTEACDDHVAIQARSANAQEAHLIGVHMLCRAFDAEIARLDAEAAAEPGTADPEAGPSPAAAESAQEARA
ncbi:Phosphoheptose isomerase 1 [Arthrobacter saudimassiliensis]|uniref:Phosphoheptose isomerase 1 n=1 Tax=Arthrobacter saudimassiliensis TaxID=1461584 RepID=A0A078MM16_9MICC|nr:Phosphoheptose isomerase 1 [Arthrobacter saudimassiliensis]